MYWYVDALKKYAVFTGRASRQAYWMFVLCHLLVAAAIGFVAYWTGVSSKGYREILNFYSLIVFIPFLALFVRRMHDVGRTGMWFLLWPVAVVFLFLGSQPGDNEYGTNPNANTRTS